MKASPFILKPAAKDYLWGGTRLNDDFNKGIDIDPLAETWECSTHPDGESVVATGEFSGSKLSDVLKAHPEFLGSHPLSNLPEGAAPQLPILIKFIDAKSDLSVQVHPTDEYALEHENGQLGKTEMWYVLDVVKDTKLVYGFHNDVNETMLRDAISDGSLEKYMQKIPVKKDDVFFIEAGTVHAIGAGCLIAEIQENSNLTYRLYDYNRTDKEGKLRELHIDKAMAVANMKSSSAPRQPMRVMNFHKGYATELLGRCKYFNVERMLLNTEVTRELPVFATSANSFQVLLCTKGCGVLTYENSALNIYRGDCVFIPSESVEFSLHGKANMLRVTC